MAGHNCTVNGSALVMAGLCPGHPRLCRQERKACLPAFAGMTTAALYKRSNVLVSQGFAIDLGQRLPQIESLQMWNAPKAPKGP
jgi:hypothetical protein